MTFSHYIKLIEEKNTARANMPNLLLQVGIHFSCFVKLQMARKVLENSQLAEVFQRERIQDIARLLQFLPQQQKNIDGA